MAGSGPVVARTREELRAALDGTPRPRGLVPTMGALHAGHASLLRRARSESATLVASIFVNPTQFDRADDLAAYPRTFDDDLAMCAAEGVDVVFAPVVDAVYPAGSSTRVDPGPIGEVLEGAHRPGHFVGVATVVTILLDLVAPDRAYFGEKDAQQLVVIRRVTRDLGLPVEIVGCPTVREPDGLAMSSRNVRLDPDDRAVALVLRRALARRARRVRGRRERCPWPARRDARRPRRRAGREGRLRERRRSGDARGGDGPAAKDRCSSRSPRPSAACASSTARRCPAGGSGRGRRPAALAARPRAR